MAYMREEESHLVNTSLTLNGKALQWYKVNDVVMGGHSTSTLSGAKEGGLRFSGVISTQDGGFASCSTLEQPLALPPTTTGFEMTVTGNLELYKFSVLTDCCCWCPSGRRDLPQLQCAAASSLRGRLPWPRSANQWRSVKLLTGYCSAASSSAIG